MTKRAMLLPLLLASCSAGVPEPAPDPSTIPASAASRAELGVATWVLNGKHDAVAGRDDSGAAIVEFEYPTSVVDATHRISHYRVRYRDGEAAFDVSVIDGEPVAEPNATEEPSLSEEAYDRVLSLLQNDLRARIPTGAALTQRLHTSSFQGRLRMQNDPVPLVEGCTELTCSEWETELADKAAEAARECDCNLLGCLSRLRSCPNAERERDHAKACSNDSACK